MIRDDIIEKRPIELLIERCHFGKPVFTKANTITSTPIINKVKVKVIYIISELKIGRIVLSNIAIEVSINNIIAGKILVTLFKKLRNIGVRLKINVISEELNTKIIMIIDSSCNIFIGLRNANIRYIPMITEKDIFSELIALLSFGFIIIL